MSPGNAAAPGGGPGDGRSWDREPTTKVTRSCDTSEQARLFLDLIGYGCPIVLCTPRRDYHPGDSTDLIPQDEWQTAEPEPGVVERYQPGRHTAALVTGHVLDGIDVDTKNGADVAAILDAANRHGVTLLGMHTTPSGGLHLLVASTGIASSSNTGTGVDFRGGCSDGTGRGLLYLPGSTRPKYPDKGYGVATPIDWDALQGVDVDEQRDALWAFLQDPLVGIRPRLTAGGEVASLVRAEEVPGLPEGLGDLIADLDAAPIGKRSGRFHHLVGEAYRAGLTQGQAVAVLTPWCEAVGKYVGRVEREVARSWARVQADDPQVWESPAPRHDPDAAPVTLDDAHKVFRRWLGDTYDTEAMDAALATVAVERLDGDPVWLLLISGSGNAKTETVNACGVGAVAVSTVSGEAALLSASPKRSRAKDSTGGLLRQLEPRGVLVVKDVTSILSMDRTARQEVLAALREIHDGHWDRPVGTDGGKTLSWAGRIAVLGAVTTAWDSAHAVIATMGDRFVLLRMDSTVHRAEAGKRAIGNTGHEEQMRAELASAAAGVIAGMSHDVGPITDDEADRIMRAADLVTRARTGVDFDYRGDVINAHAPEMPTRFAKELAQVLRGAVAIGMERGQALRLAIRCARDSMPPLRLAIIDDLAERPNSTPTEVRRRLGKPRATVDRQMQALHMLGVCELDEIEMGSGKTQWRYSLAADVDPTCLTITRNVEESGECGEKREEVTLSAARSPYLNKSGNAPDGPRDPA